MNESLLKPCPFCGGRPYFVRSGTNRVSCIVQCENCGAKLESGDEGDASGRTWNTRRGVGCALDTDGDGNCSKHPQGCYATLEAENARLRGVLRDSSEAIQAAFMKGFCTHKQSPATDGHGEDVKAWITRRDEALTDHSGDANKMVPVDLDAKGRPTKVGTYEFKGSIDGGAWFDDKIRECWIKVEVWHNEASGRLNGCMYDADGDYEGNSALVAFKGEWRQKEGT